mmetsp:Transcript_8694/g.16873  ORF Transcript_8694/g.16873 Transcript_8694/m.16873 type:complete len:533 (-) Transcript_8694:83-1681(-)
MASTVDADRIAEHEESAKLQQKKIDTLAKWIRESKYTVFYTGAGVSTSAGIGDYRGPTGAWTMGRIRELRRLEARGNMGAEEKGELRKLLAEAEKKGRQKRVPMIDAQPTLAHMAMATLVRRKMAHYVVTTNLDGIHRKSGLRAHEQVCNLHGCVYAERCTGCGYDFERNYYTRREKIHVHDHHVGACSRCGSAVPRSYTGRPSSRNTGADSEGYRENRLVGTQDKAVGTKDTHINFGECLDDMDWNDAKRHCERADLCVVAGTSMSLRHITHFPFMAKRTVIVNLQETPDDRRCHLRIWGKTDPVFDALMKSLDLAIDSPPVWRPRDAVPLNKIPSYVSRYYREAARRLEQLTLAAEKKALAAEKNANAEKERKRVELERKAAKEAEESKALASFPRTFIIGNTVEASSTEGMVKWTMSVTSKDEKNAPASRFVDRVTYHLHPTFTPSSVSVDASTTNKNFSMSRVGWGVFPVRVEIHFNERFGLKPMTTTHQLSFSGGGSSNEVAVRVEKMPEIRSSVEVGKPVTSLLCC